MEKKIKISKARLAVCLYRFQAAFRNVLKRHAIQNRSAIRKYPTYRPISAFVTSRRRIFPASLTGETGYHRSALHKTNDWRIRDSVRREGSSTQARRRRGLDEVLEPGITSSGYSVSGTGAKGGTGRSSRGVIKRRTPGRLRSDSVVLKLPHVTRVVTRPRFSATSAAIARTGVRDRSEDIRRTNIRKGRSGILDSVRAIVQREESAGETRGRKGGEGAKRDPMPSCTCTRGRGCAHTHTWYMQGRTT